MATAVLATPIIDESMPVFTDDEAVSKSATRYLFFPGDVIAPRRKRELREMTGFGVKFDANANKVFPLYSAGGEEINSPCLLRTKGVLPRCMFTPLEIAAVWLPPELIPAGAETFEGFPQAGARWHETLPGVKAFPGEQIRSILTWANNDQGQSKGVVEIAALRDWSWTDVVGRGVQRFFFPEYPKLPVTLRGVEEAILTAHSQTKDGSDFRSIAEEMLSACEQFRLWAMDRIKFEQTLVATGTMKEGWTYRFSDVAEQLMAQLEITKPDEQLLKATQLQTQLNQTVGNLIEKQATERNVEVVDVLKQLQENQLMLAQMFGQIMDKLTTPAQPAPSPAAQSVQENPKPKAK
jgi:hypothetical protein